MEEENQSLLNDQVRRSLEAHTQSIDAMLPVVTFLADVANRKYKSIDDASKEASRLFIQLERKLIVISGRYNGHNSRN